MVLFAKLPAGTKPLSAGGAWYRPAGLPFQGSARLPRLHRPALNRRRKPVLRHPSRWRAEPMVISYPMAMHRRHGALPGFHWTV